MTILVTYNRQAAVEFNHILSRLPGSEEDRDRLLVEYLAELAARIREFKGFPPDALKDESHRPPVHRIQSFDNIWVEYTVEDQRAWFWRHRRIVTITSFRMMTSAGVAPQR
jgi:hypothetical protein